MVIQAGREGRPTPERLLQFFTYGHLPPALQAVSQPFCDMAHRLVETLPSNAERTIALRKLMESKDAAVRAAIEKGVPRA